MFWRSAADRSLGRTNGVGVECQGNASGLNCPLNGLGTVALILSGGPPVPEIEHESHVTCFDLAIHSLVSAKVCRNGSLPRVNSDRAPTCVSIRWPPHPDLLLNLPASAGGQTLARLLLHPPCPAQSSSCFQLPAMEQTFFPAAAPQREKVVPPVLSIVRAAKVGRWRRFGKSRRSRNSHRQALPNQGDTPPGAPPLGLEKA